jgi:5-methylcytosine-specific restriction endonuclease McrA
MLNAFVERVVPSKVYERDNWKCQLCHEPVDRTLHGWDRMAATLDHIVPLTLGGLHIYTNVQLAHRACNSAKSNHYSGQLPLPI